MFKQDIKALQDQYKIFTLDRSDHLVFKCSPVFNIGPYCLTYLNGFPLCIGINR